MVELLIENGAKVDAEDEKGATPLRLAVFNGSFLIHSINEIRV